MITGHRPENELSYLAHRSRLDGKASMGNWYIDFHTLRELMDFVRQHGRIIIKPPTYEDTVGDIEIYDGKREELHLDDIIN